MRKVNLHDLMYSDGSYADILYAYSYCWKTERETSISSNSICSCNWKRMYVFSKGWAKNYTASLRELNW